MATAGEPLELDMRDAMQCRARLVVRIKGLRWVKLGWYLVWVGAWIMGVPVDIDDSEEEEHGESV